MTPSWRRGVSAVELAVLALAAGPAPAAWAEHGADPLVAGVWLNSSSPVSGETVSAGRTVSGHAQVLEGVQQISLYVVPAGRPLDLVADAPVATAAPSAPLGLGAVDFDLAWDTARSPLGSVDLHVVAATLLRDVGTAVTGVRVVRAPATSIRVPTAFASGSRPAAAPVGARRAAAALPGASDGVYLGGYDAALPYQRTALTTPAPALGSISARPVASSSGPPRGGWVSAALGLMLVVCTAHVHRVLRPVTSPTPFTESREGR